MMGMKVFTRTARRDYPDPWLPPKTGRDAMLTKPHQNARTHSRHSTWVAEIQTLNPHVGGFYETAGKVVYHAGACWLQVRRDMGTLFSGIRHRSRLFAGD